MAKKKRKKAAPKKRRAKIGDTKLIIPSKKNRTVKLKRNKKSGMFQSISGEQSTPLEIGLQLTLLEFKINKLKAEKKSAKLKADKKDLQYKISIMTKQFKALKAYLNTIAKFR